MPGLRGYPQMRDCVGANVGLVCGKPCIRTDREVNGTAVWCKLIWC